MLMFGWVSLSYCFIINLQHYNLNIKQKIWPSCLLLVGRGGEKKALNQPGKFLTLR